MNRQARPRHSIIRSDQIEYGAWLVIDARGGLRVTRDKPATRADERRIAINVTVPRSIFETPDLRINVMLSGNAAEPNALEIKKAVSKAVEGYGLEVRLGAPEPEEPATNKRGKP